MILSLDPITEPHVMSDEQNLLPCIIYQVQDLPELRPVVRGGQGGRDPPNLGREGGSNMTCEAGH